MTSPFSLHFCSLSKVPLFQKFSGPQNAVEDGLLITPPKSP